MRPITVTELLATYVPQLPDPKTYGWQAINLGPDVRFHKNKAGDGWVINNPVVVDEAVRAPSATKPEA